MLMGALDSVRTQTLPPQADDRRRRLQRGSVQAADLHRPGRRDRGKQPGPRACPAPATPEPPSPRPRSSRSSTTTPRPRRTGSNGSPRLYDDPDVLAVGGRVEPRWEAGRPGYFAEELDWIVGCTYRGMPKVAAEVRNVIGANMSFRADVLDRVGGFNTALGRQDAIPLGCEETELCIRAVIGAPGSRVVYEPAALVHHHVPAERGTLRYMLSRSWSEGISKAQVSRVVGHKRALGPERRYVRQVLPRAVFAGIRDWIRGEDPAGLGRAGAIIAVLARHRHRLCARPPAACRRPRR